MSWLIDIPASEKTAVQIINCIVVEDDRTERKVAATVEIDHDALAWLVRKAWRNKSRKSTDGPLTVRVTGKT